jgi:hypothetical protein
MSQQPKFNHTWKNTIALGLFFLCLIMTCKIGKMDQESFNCMMSDNYTFLKIKREMLDTPERTTDDSE